MPWHSFGRKNIGYLFAISYGANVIWDFDDDNIIKFWMKGASPDNLLEIDHFINNLHSKFQKNESKLHLPIDCYFWHYDLICHFRY